MNIFVLDYNPQVAAEFHCDKHVVKMILESAQILCAVHRKVYLKAMKKQYTPLEMEQSLIAERLIKEIPYKLTHANHPCTIWAGESKQNYLWLTELAEHLNNEYKFRFNHEVNHKSYDVIANLPDIDLPDTGLTKFAEAMPDYCKVTDCTVMNYREYYRKEKAHILKYTNASTPYWLGK